MAYSVMQDSNINARTVSGRFRQWGFGGGTRAFGTGVMEGFGFGNASGKFRFLEGAGLKRAGIGLLGSAGFGYAAYAATGSPLIGVAGGLATMSKPASLALGPAFMAYGAVQGWKREGMWGATKSVATDAAMWGAFKVGTTAASVAFKGTAIAGVGKAAMAVAYPVAIAAALGYGAYKGSQYLAERGRNVLQSEFVGSTAAFETQAAYTMRQRSLQEINRSHTNARTILGSEAQYMHMR